MVEVVFLIFFSIVLFIAEPTGSVNLTVVDENLYNVYRLHSFIKYRSGNIYFTDDLNKYGCWCGQQGQGQPVDNLDRCCFQHRICMNEILKSSCPISSQYYRFNVCFNVLVNCVDTDLCKHTFCSCDAKAVECLSNNESSYNRQYKDGEKKDYCISCCFKHRICIKEALNSSCPLSSKFYEVNVCPNESVTCVDTDPCKHKFCSCDAKAAECLTDHETSYNRHYKDGDKKVYCRH